MNLSAEALKARFPKAIGIQLPYAVSQAAPLPPGGTILEAATDISVRSGDQVYAYRTDDVRVTKIPGGQAVFGFDYVFTPDNVLLSDSGYVGLDMATGWWFPHVAEGDKVLHPWPPKVTFIDEDVLYMGGPHSFHVGHWIVDFLPRLRAREVAPMKIAIPPMKIAIPQQLFPKLRDLLKMFDVRPEEVIECELGWRYRFRNIYVVQKGSGHRPTPGNITFLHQYMRPRIPGGPAKRTWIVRDAERRRTLNMEAMQKLLESFGFYSISLGNMSIADQAAQVGRSQIVIATYGSDLEASLFMQPGTHLIELGYERIRAAHAATTCSFLGVHHHQLISTEEYEVASGMKKDRDFVVDCDALKGMLSAIIGRSAPSDS